MSQPSIVIVGAGIFGATAAVELRRRGHNVTVVDPGPIPHPLAASTDISKVVRMEYGADETYMALMEIAREGWLRWNEAWIAAGNDALYHETGVVMMCREPMAPGGFEYESWRLLNNRGHRPERLDSAAIRRRYPAWRGERYVDGFYHAKGGFAESGRVVEALLTQATGAGVVLAQGEKATTLVESGGGIHGVRTTLGRVIPADVTILATGVWAAHLAPSLKHAIRATGHPVFHLRPTDPSLFAPAQFPTFTADVSRTGYYGFPLNRDGVVKIANHGLGVAMDADAERAITAADEARLRGFLQDTFPSLADAEIVYTRLCLYADTQDEHFWIARDPGRDGLVVAGGGSGHGFKFAPVLGGLVADCVAGRDNPWLAKFGWRPGLRLDRGQEAARCHFDEDPTP